MQVTILFFGQLTDITGTDNMQSAGLTDTNSLITSLQQKFPALVNAKYILAVDNKVIKGNTALNNNSTVALMPPFSGG